MDDQSTVRIAVLDTAADDEGLWSESRSLQREMNRLSDVGSICLPADQEASDDFRIGVGLAEIGVLTLTTLGPASLYAVVSILRAWVDLAKSRRVVIESNGDRLELSGHGARQQQKVIEVWLERQKEPHRIENRESDSK